jgi:cytochrome c oxidase cbb3-type subunit III
MQQTHIEAHQDPLREHVYDGIQEYDNRLPNWWLWTFYCAIIFAVGYWFYYQQSGDAVTADVQLQMEQAAIAARAASLSKGPLTDDQLWAMSQDPTTVAAGAATFATTCATCHGENLKGKIGPDLTDQVWIHGGTPAEIVHTITTGVGAKGMPTWGPILGAKRINDVAAFVLSHHKKGEPIVKAP